MAARRHVPSSIASAQQTGGVGRDGEAYCAAAPAIGYRHLSERVPGRPPRVLEVADVGPQPQADAGADRRDDDMLVLLERHADAAHQIRGPVHPPEALIDLLGIAQV